MKYQSFEMNSFSTIRNSRYKKESDTFSINYVLNLNKKRQTIRRVLLIFSVLFITSLQAHAQKNIKSINPVHFQQIEVESYRKESILNILNSTLSIFSFAINAQQKPDFTNVPGSIVDHCHINTKMYMPTSSIVVMPNGDYVVAHDHGYFDHSKCPGIIKVFGSSDKGKTWKLRSTTRGRHNSLFLHRDALYLIGPIHQYGDAIIRRSIDGGQTWTKPKDEKTGLLRNDATFHSAGVPVVLHKDRIWRAFEIAHGGGKGRSEWEVVVFSAREDSDLLDANNWTLSKPMKQDGNWDQWIEGNIVIAPGGELVNILRANRKSDDKAVIIHVSNDGRELSYDPKKDVIDFPGGGLKFTIRYDSVSHRYWSLANPDRNILVLTSSPDLKNWKVHKTVLKTEKKYSFHYADFVIEDNDLIFTSRTAYPDGMGGPHNRHDNNFITFHRIKNFREMYNFDDPSWEQE